jgi:hypothetical protein
MRREHPFIKHVKRECRRYGVKLILASVDTYKDDDVDECGGYFSGDPLELLVAKKVRYKEFLGRLVHEYSHFEQWRDNSKYSGNGIKGNRSWRIVSNWIDGKTYERSIVIKAINTMRDCELDCNRRALKNIEKFRIPIDVDRFCKEASAYAYFHNYIKISRKWEYKKSTVEDIKPLRKIMPSNLDGNYIQLPKRVKELLDKHLR